LKTKGFTLIELLVVIVIIGILVAIALPNFIKIKDKAKEAEVKQNLHSIQLAIERYATDQSGNYPYFLFGGDTFYNIGTANNIGDWAVGGGGLGPGWALPFDMFRWAGAGWQYTSVTGADIESGNIDSGFGDTLEYEAYMTKYPRNPFVVGDAGIQYSQEMLHDTSDNNNNMAAYGGRLGDLMFNVGCWGENPQLEKLDQGVGETYNDLPGTFYYHPRWADGVSNFGHNMKQNTAVGGNGVLATILVPAPLDDSAGVSSLDVMGYDLVAIGAARTKGQDIDNKANFAGWTGDKYRTGYFTLGQERNPYVRAGDYGSNSDYDERPFSDGRADFFIIHLSSGLDRKVQDFSNES